MALGQVRVEELGIMTSCKRLPDAVPNMTPNHKQSVIKSPKRSLLAG